MKKIFSALALLSTVFVCAHEGSEEESKKVVVEEQHLTCNCPGHDVDITGEEEDKDVEEALLACGSSSCSHEKEKK